VFESLGNHLPREFVLKRIFKIGGFFGTIVSNKRLRRSSRPASREVLGSDEDLALVSKTRKGKGMVPNKKGKNEEGTSQPGKKKDLSKIKFFACHKNGHYAS
jgi:hypothetical protein